MSLIKIFLTVMVLSLLSAVTAHPRPRPRPSGPPPTAKALYFLTNNAQNAVVAVGLDADGFITGRGTVVSTGGAGANGIDGATNMSAMPDALFSQSALTVSDNSLFAINPRSNTLSMFSLSTPIPTLLGAPSPIPGSFPVTVAASSLHRLVCVGTTGSTAGVACVPFSPGIGLVGPFDALRPFNLGQSDPPVGPTNTVSHVFFAGNQDVLLVTVKGDPARDKNKTGFIAAFPVQNGGVSQTGVVTSPEGTAVLFGSAVVPGSTTGDVLVTDASFGAVVLGIDRSGNVRARGRVVVDGQKATCWAAISPATGTGFVTDVARNRLVEVSLVGDVKVLGEIDLSSQTGDPGLIDLAAAGDLVYALSPGNGTVGAAISVVDVRSKKLVQHAGLAGVGANGNAMGMALAF